MTKHYPELEKLLEKQLHVKMLYALSEPILKKVKETGRVRFEYSYIKISEYNGCRLLSVCQVGSAVSKYTFNLDKMKPTFRSSRKETVMKPETYALINKIYNNVDKASANTPQYMFND